MPKAEYIFAGLLVALFIIGSVSAFRCERRVWNGGLCDKCWTPWVIFDMDSQGGRGYKCSGCAETQRVWISYPRVERKGCISDAEA
jgi:hypothetical protein